MIININKNIINKGDKKIYLFHNPKKLLNRYFFSDNKFIKIGIRREIVIGIPKLIIKLIFFKLNIFRILEKFPRNSNIRQKIINIYSLALLTNGIKKYSNSILIIGDYQDALNMAVLQLSYFFEKSEFWIINQGSGSIERKIKFKYPKNVSKVFFPYSNESIYENNLLLKASSKNSGIKFLNIDTTLNIEISNNLNKLAIFQGYDKRKKLYPFYIFFIIKEIYLITFIKEFSFFDKIDFFLHPRLKYLSIFNFINSNKLISFKVLNPNAKYKYNFIISYSPTINSSLKKNIKNSENYLSEVGLNFNKKNIMKSLKKFLS